MSTPVQRQYWELKKQNPEAILFFRLGDFYELFFEDAIIGSKVLGITLTARHRGSENEMPMAGFPYHSHKPYLETLIENGYKVAIAEQFEQEDKKIIRKVDRIITPGTTLEDGNLEQSNNNYLAAVFFDNKKNIYALAHTDLSTGEFRTCQLNDELSFFDELYKINPKEILCDQAVFQNENIIQKFPATLLSPKKFPKANQAQETLNQHFPENHLQISGVEKLQSVLIVSSVILNYCQETQLTKLENLNKIQHYAPGSFMMLDHQTFSHLEIFQCLQPDSQENTLYSVFEKSKTAMGGRCLRQWIMRPLINTKEINERLESVEAFTKNLSVQENLSNSLQEVPDLERLLGRLANKKGNARDLAFFRQAFSVFPVITNEIKSLNIPILSEKIKHLQSFESLLKKLEESLLDLPPLEITQGGMIRDGFHARLDELRILNKNSDAWLKDFLEKQKTQTGIQNIRIKYSKNFGFCLEISKAQAEKAPGNWTRKQTLVNAERFTTDELNEYENQVLSAEEESIKLEYKLFVKLRDEFLQYIKPIQEAAKALGYFDTLLTLALTARSQRWNRPRISENNEKLKIVDGRHPVVEAQGNTNFIANSLHMSEDKSRFHLITGPNMAGKSTFLRQNALIILLGQIGSFVPAAEAQWSVVDRIFTRVGASDNLAAGKSTFFVEMTETASILHQATDKSFVILDEIGRGTSTFDGIALAWAITEFLHNKTKAKTLFATHYHELIDLVSDLKAAQNFHVSVSQNKKGIIFLRQVRKGGISDSFGIEVAKLAGVPSEVIQNAREVLARLESENLLSGKPNLFALPQKEKVIEIKKHSAVEDFTASINPDDLSPKEALEKWYEIQQLK